VKLEQDVETEDETPALTIYLKRDTNVEKERKSGTRTTEITADKFYAVALSNEAKVVLAKNKK
ncbi:MAG: N4-gp56 family major capsid protein, partial [Oscillospiraceae bacterium]